MTQSDLTLIIHALLAIAPSGGGSPAYTLARNLISNHNIEPNDDAIEQMQLTIHAEVSEALT